VAEEKRGEEETGNSRLQLFLSTLISGIGGVFGQTHPHSVMDLGTLDQNQPPIKVPGNFLSFSVQSFLWIRFPYFFFCFSGDLFAHQIVILCYSEKASIWVCLRPYNSFWKN